MLKISRKRLIYIGVAIIISVVIGIVCLVFGGSNNKKDSEKSEIEQQVNQFNMNFIEYIGMGKDEVQVKSLANKVIINNANNDRKVTINNISTSKKIIEEFGIVKGNYDIMCEKDEDGFIKNIKIIESVK